VAREKRPSLGRLAGVAVSDLGDHYVEVAALRATMLLRSWPLAARSGVNFAMNTAYCLSSLRLPSAPGRLARRCSCSCSCAAGRRSLSAAGGPLGGAGRCAAFQSPLSRRLLRGNRDASLRDAPQGEVMRPGSGARARDPFQAEMVAQRRPRIVGAEQATFLQDRHHQPGEIVELAGEEGRHDVEAVGGAGTSEAKLRAT
jgi:hypothetical protein